MDIEPGNQPGHAYVVCPVCGYKQLFLQLPLLLVTGASGAGKTAVYRYLVHRVRSAVLLDSDVLWSRAFAQAEDDYHSYYETWLSVCKHIGQSGRPVVLFGAGTGVTSNIEPCMERRFFSTLHYLALTCDDEVLSERLRRRPSWRACNSDFIQKQVEFNQWFKQASASGAPITLLDTAGIPLETTAGQVRAWIHRTIRSTTRRNDHQAM